MGTLDPTAEFLNQEIFKMLVSGALNILKTEKRRLQRITSVAHKLTPKVERVLPIGLELGHWL
jgi:hypothetical protein